MGTGHLRSFLKSWRALYRSKPELEYDPQWLWQMFVIYFNFCKTILGSTHELVQATSLQWDAYRMAVMEPESLDHRTRRGGKTLKLSHMCVFWAELGFGPCKGKVIYRCPHVNQLKGLKQWLRQNPFYIRCRTHEYECDLLDQYFPVDLACISESTSTGLECSVLIEDEYSIIDKNSEIYRWMLDSRAFLAKGATYTKRHIHASSGRKNTPFEDDFLYLQAHAPNSIFTMPWYQTTWITQEFVEKERKKNFFAQYWIEEQYECMWVMASGMFFDEKKLHICGVNGVPIDYFAQKGIFQPTTGGLDWNGMAVGHVLYIGSIVENAVFLFEEMVFKSVFEVKVWLDQHPLVDVEIEGKPMKDGYNAGFSDHLMSLGANCSYQGWNQEDGVKDNRLAMAQRMDFYVMPGCKWFIKNFKEACYDPKPADKVKLLKTPDQHGLDAVLHLLHTGGTLDIASNYERSYFQQQQSQSMFDMVKYRSRV